MSSLKINARMKTIFVVRKKRKIKSFFVVISVYKIGLDKIQRETWDQYTLFVTVLLCNIVLQIAKPKIDNL